jgi:valyl-tRNA synthetase
MKQKTSLEGAFDPTQVEEGWYDWWKQQGFFTANPHSDKEPYTIVIPPPNVTGSLHMGHALTVTIQDVLIRWKRMSGYEVLWLPGTDHAGIATQVLVERMLRRQGISRHDLGREAFIEQVWAWKAKYGDRIERQLERIGSSVDWTRDRFTMDEGLSAAVREVFVRLYEEGLIYRAERLINWDPEAQTVLSSLEVEQEEEDGHLWHIAYPLEQRPVAGDRRGHHAPRDDAGRRAGGGPPGRRALQGPHRAHGDAPDRRREIPIIADDYTDPAFGSGAVKITPAHDANDFECRPAPRPGHAGDRHPSREMQE